MDEEACPKCRSTEYEVEDGGLYVCDNCGLRWQG
ncbi:TFIIB-type zinc finger domain-containing protein [Halobellus rufus]|nr:TFIIB-type zinc finger domain-containing protein [Halobellus rufus]